MFCHFGSLQVEYGTPSHSLKILKTFKTFPWWNWTFWFILDCDRKTLGAHYAPYCTTVFVMQHKYISPLIYPITSVINIKLQWMVQCTFHIPIQFFSLILSGCIQLISLLWFKWMVEFNLSSINGHKIHCPSWILHNAHV